MNSSDLVTIMGNIGRSLIPVQTLISGLGYLIGIFFIIHALLKLKKIGGSKGGSQEKPFGAIAYFVVGAMLIFLPSTIRIFSNTTFGVGNILQYTPFNPYDVYSSMGLMVQTAGIIWFVRGCVLLVHSSEPGTQEGPKGLTFVLAGILAMNFQETYGILNYIVVHFLSITNMGSSGTGSGSGSSGT